MGVPLHHLSRFAKLAAAEPPLVFLLEVDVEHPHHRLRDISAADRAQQLAALSLRVHIKINF